MISSDVMRGYNDTLILSILAQGDNYGYLISRRISQLADGHYDIKETTLYSALGRLEKKGYIVSYVGGQTNGRQRTYYQITAYGRKYLMSKQVEWRLVEAVMQRFICLDEEGGQDAKDC